MNNDILIGNNLSNIPSVKIGLRKETFLDKFPKDKDVDNFLIKLKNIALIVLILSVALFAIWRIIVGIW